VAHVGSYQTPPEAALSELARQLDLWPSRLAGRLFQASRQLRASRRTRREAGSEPPRVIVEPDATPAQLAAALAAAQHAGALESAVVLAERLEPALERPNCPIREVELVVEALLMCGERTRAIRCAKAHAARLASSAGGAGVLELTGLGADGLWLPDGRPHALAISRRLREGTLSAEALAEAVLRRSRSCLRYPELLLLLHSALVTCEPGRALTFLNRYWRTHGLSAATLAVKQDASAPWLGALHFPSLPPRTGPLVSVVVAARNAASTVGYALRSLLVQSYRNLEILVCDDGSDDATPDVIRAFARDPRVRLYRSPGQQGAYNVRNALIARARGELVTFQDADDLALPERIEKQVSSVQGGAAVACVANWLRIAPDGRIAFFKDSKASRLCRVSLMLRREAFDACGPFRSARFGADLELHATLCARFGAARVKRVDAPLLIGLWSAGSVTRTSGAEALENGYRSPARRSYSELVYQQLASGQSLASDAQIAERLRAFDNWIEPAPITEIGA
jgi:hypothetical protein